MVKFEVHTLSFLVSYLDVQTVRLPFYKIIEGLGINRESAYTVKLLDENYLIQQSTVIGEFCNAS